ncbi:hypothetical protein ACJMK2_037990 [Sinanodonta woodiana]|uniref:Potassium channel subfamily K member 1 n=1 Tax=Sinanodonta woodiana TaxID=1069815 RepID=A0ABD3WMK6_SINWO
MSICMRKSNIRLLVLVAFYIIFLVVGASIFSAIEGPQERTLVNELKDKRSKFLKEHGCLKDEELEEFIVAIVQATNQGISAVRNVTISEPNWSFGQSMFFAGTVILTIGYGRVSPLSEAGKAFCIIYAMIGIPLTLILFSAVVERLMIPTTMFLKFMFRKLGHLYKVFHIQLLHLFIIIMLILVFIYLIPAGIFYTLEPSWSYFDAFYYCFVSLTTIGLGDYVPGDNPDQQQRPVYKVATTLYLIIGLLMMMLLLAVVYEIPELNIGFHFFMRSDHEEERAHLHPSTHESGLKYSKQIDEDTPAVSGYQAGPGFQRTATYQQEAESAEIH